MRVRNGEVLTTDGPFAETKEQLAGYYVVDCKDLDEAIEVAAKIPGAQERWHRSEADLGDVTSDVEAAVAEAFQAEWGRVVATLVRLTGDWDLAEECAQDAFATALERWPRDGIPRRPGAWLTTVARHRAVDRASARPVWASQDAGGRRHGTAESEDERAGWTRTRCPTTGSA